jgi:hypothetical protein
MEMTLVEELRKLEHISALYGRSADRIEELDRNPAWFRVTTDELLYELKRRTEC